MYYTDNDYRLYHHGILGQKWGRKNGPPYPLDASDHSAAEKKAGWRKSLENATKSDGIKGAVARAAARAVDRRDFQRDTRRDIMRNVIETKGFKNKISEAVGLGRSRTIARNQVITNKKLMEHSRNEWAKKKYEADAKNADEMVNYYQKRINRYGKNAVKAFAHDFTQQYMGNPELSQVAFHRASGRVTTRGREALSNALTGGIAGLVLDAKYEREQAKKGS